MRHLCILSCMALLFTSACFDFSVPKETKIGCSKKDDACPEGFVCKPAIGVCVAVEGADTGAPELVGAAELVPNRGTAGTLFRLQFTTSEALGDVPVVKIDLGESKATMEMDREASETAARAYSFYYVAGGDEPEGNFEIHIDLVDTLGNAAKGISGGIIQLDFTPPAFASDPALSTTHLGENTTTTVTLSFNEDMQGQSQAWLEPVDPAVTSPSLHFVARSASSSRVHLLDYTSDGTEPEVAYVVLCRGTDLAGNDSGPLVAGQLSIDRNGPQVLTDPPVSVSPATATLEQTINVEIHTNELIGGSPSLVGVSTSGAADIDFDLAQMGDRVLSFWFLVGANQDGAYQLWLEDLVDLAGNGTPRQLVGEVLIDTQRPLVGSLLVEPERIDEDGTVTVSIVADEAQSAVSAKIGDLDMDCSAFSQTAPNFVCTYQMQGSEILAGQEVPQVVLVEMEDAAGNRSATSGDVVFDFKDPVAQMQIERAFAKIGDTIYVTMTADNVLTSGPSLTVSHSDQQATLDFELAPDTTYMFAHTVTSGDTEGAYDLQFAMADLAGNTGSYTSGSAIHLDSVPPSIVSHTVDHMYVARDGSVNIEVYTPDSDASIVVFFGAEQFTCLAYSPATNSFVCSYSAADHPGLAGEEYAETVFINLTDPAGNTSNSSANVFFDFEPPQAVDLLTRLEKREGEDWGGLSEVTAWGPASVLVLSFSTTEPLVGVPEVQLECAPSDEAFVRDQSENSTSFFRFRAEFPNRNGTCQVYAILEDRAGNQIQDDLDGTSFLLDSVKPRLKYFPTGVKHLRAPWFSAFQEGGGGSDSHFVVSEDLGYGEAFDARLIEFGTFTEEQDQDQIAAVNIYSSTHAYLGTLERQADGWLPIKLPGFDDLFVHYSLVDHAGNFTSQVRINRTQWIASFHGQGTDGNPHRLEEWEHFGQKRHNSLPHQLAAKSLLQKPDENRVLTHGAGRWIYKSWYLNSAPEVLKNSAMAYDSSRDRVVLFGGYKFDPQGETWEFNGNGMIQVCDIINLCSGPSPRQGSAMAYDASAAKVVLYGGQNIENLGDTWVWDGESWTEKCIYCSKTPPALSGHAMAYHAGTVRTVLVGDMDNYWTWSGSTWTEHDKTAPRLIEHAMTYDERRDVVVLFGGKSGAVYSNETWEWDGNTWSLACDGITCTGPGARTEHTLSYDSHNGRVLLVGGRENDSDLFDDVWSWDGTQWLQVCGGTTGCSAQARAQHVAAFLKSEEQLYVVGGVSDEPQTEFFLYQFDGAEWHATCVGEGCGIPGPRSDQSMAYDAARNSTLMIGGTLRTVGYDETWKWDGYSWNQVCGAPTGCDSVNNGALVYDTELQQVTMVSWSRTQQKMSTWDGTQWDEICGSTIMCLDQPGTSREQVIYDSDQNRYALFGFDDGVSGDQLWVRDGLWRKWCGQGAADECAGPSARHSSSTVYDPENGQLVLFGGSPDSLRQDDETWVYEWNEAGNSGTWSHVCGGDTGCSGPAERLNHSMAYDTKRKVVTLFGGEAEYSEGDPTYDDLWLWDGRAWSQVTGDMIAALKPVARYGHSIAYDQQRERIVLFGGSSGYDELNDTWEFDYESDNRPAHVLVAQTQSSHPADCLGICQVSGVRIHWSAGGVGETPGGSQVQGVALWSWQRGSWKQLLTNSAGVSSPATLEWFTEDPVEFERMFIGDGELYFAVTPLGINGARLDGAQVVSDWVEVVVSYLKPS